MRALSTASIDRLPRRILLGLGLAVFCSGLDSTAGAAALADQVLVIKSEQRLYLMRRHEVLASYRVALGREPRGTKLQAGDARTPEGSYRLGRRNPASRFYRSIAISYPNEVDRARARAMGTTAGGDIMLHGLPNERPDWGDGHWMFNWTSGCIAVTNAEMDRIWDSVAEGTPIEIRP